MNYPEEERGFAMMTHLENALVYTVTFMRQITGQGNIGEWEITIAAIRQSRQW
jgi:hypothetical protein